MFGFTGVAPGTRDGDVDGCQPSRNVARSIRLAHVTL